MFKQRTEGVPQVVKSIEHVSCTKAAPEKFDPSEARFPYSLKGSEKPLKLVQSELKKLRQAVRRLHRLRRFQKHLIPKGDQRNLNPRNLCNLRMAHSRFTVSMNSVTLRQLADR